MIQKWLIMERLACSKRMISANSEQRTLIDVFSEHSFLNCSVLVNGQIHSEEQILMFRICESREK